MAKKQLVLIFKPGKQKVDCKELLKLFDVEQGIYQNSSKEMPVWLNDALSVLYEVTQVVESELSSGKYTLISVPLACAKSSTMSALWIRYSERLVTQYWLEPISLTKIERLIYQYHQLEVAFDHLVTSENLFVDIYSDVSSEPNAEIATGVAEKRFEQAYQTSYWAISDTKALIKKRLSGLVQRGVANQALFSTPK